MPYRTSIWEWTPPLYNLAKKYYLTGEADWVDKKTLENIEREVILTQYNLIGLKAQELKLPTMDGDWVSLYETEAPFTLLLFWEADCGHCKKQVPQVKTGLLDKFKPYGFKVFAVHTQNDKENGKILLPNMNYSISSTVGILRIKLISGYTITSILLRSCISWIRKKKSSPRNWISNNLQIS